MEIIIKEKLRALREAKGWSRETLSKKAGVTLQTAFRAETNGRINLVNYIKIYNTLHGIPIPDDPYFHYADSGYSE